MKKISILLVALLFLSVQFSSAALSKKDSTDEGIHWISFEQAEKEMKKQPKKVLIDVYTGWCGWCKVMAKKTYTNPELIKYVNKNFYAIKFDAEQKSTIHFMDKDWAYNKQYKVNELAANLLKGRLSYPTTVIMEENFKSAEPIPGYLQVPVMESIIKYFGNNVYLHEKWDEYQKNFKSTWASNEKK